MLSMGFFSMFLFIYQALQVYPPHLLHMSLPNPLEYPYIYKKPRAVKIETTRCPNRLSGATRPTGELVRDEQMTEQQVSWGD